ncbi:MAG: NUDIX domain-containing protein [Chloroflexi bacterium]|nr:NUDIX domain-containing protein [Chloroflexota bacterium]
MTETFAGTEAAVEQVLVVPRSTLMGDPGWHGVRTQGLAAFEAFVAAAGRFAPRPDMERSRAWKQVIPYLVLRDRGRYFLMQRTRGGADARLHDRWSIGVGGHLNPGDRDLLGGLRREWREELVADFVPGFELVGLLNDDTTDVGGVHLGAVYVAEADGRPVEVRETDKLRGSFAPRDDVRTVEANLETWSRLVFDFLESGSAR